MFARINGKNNIMVRHINRQPRPSIMAKNTIRIVWMKPTLDLGINLILMTAFTLGGNP
jgi:hypothetical protein